MEEGERESGREAKRMRKTAVKAGNCRAKLKVWSLHTHTHTCTTQVLREAVEEGREASIRGQFGIASGSCHVLNVQN